MLFFQDVQPPKLTLKPVVELRARNERRIDRDFSDAASDNRSELQTRGRFGFDFTYGKNASGKIRYQYAHSTIWTPQLNFSDENSDLYLGFVDYKAEPGIFSIGRQTLRKGGQRLLEESNFGQRSKSFDVARFRNSRWDVFGGRVGYVSNETDHSRIAGASYASQYGETLAFYKHDVDRDQNFWTIDHFWKKDFGPWSLQAEGTIQRGRVGTQKLNSWMAHGRASYKIDPKWTAFVEANVASGGGDSNESKLFDPLYGPPHATVGLSDVQGLRNVRHLEIGVSTKPTPKLEWMVAVQFYRLYDPQDSWYSGSANRRPGGTFRDSTGASGANVGHEFNFMARYDITKHDSVQLELGLVKPGSFIKAFNGPATTDHVWWMLTYNWKL